MSAPALKLQCRKDAASAARFALLSPTVRARLVDSLSDMRITRIDIERALVLQSEGREPDDARLFWAFAAVEDRLPGLLKDELPVGWLVRDRFFRSPKTVAQVLFELRRRSAPVSKSTLFYQLSHETSSRRLVRKDQAYIES